MKRIRMSRLERAGRLYKNDPEAFRLRNEKRIKYLSMLDEINPKLAERYRTVYKDVLSFYEQKDSGQTER